MPKTVDEWAHSLNNALTAHANNPTARSNAQVAADCILDECDGMLIEGNENNRDRDDLANALVAYAKLLRKHSPHNLEGRHMKTVDKLVTVKWRTACLTLVVVGTIQWIACNFVHH